MLTCDVCSRPRIVRAVVRYLRERRRLWLCAGCRHMVRQTLAEQTVAELIAESAATGRVTQHEYTAELAGELSHQCDGLQYAEGAHRPRDGGKVIMTAWGEREGLHWRVNLVAPYPPAPRDV